MIISLLLAVTLTGAATVDEAIELYEMGDIPGAIVSLEELITSSVLSYDEQLRAYDRLGSAYYAMGQLDDARSAYFELLKLDTYYDFSPSANPRLRELLSSVRLESMATALVQSDPPGAFVTLDDELLGVTPMLVDGLMGGTNYNIAVYAVGFEPEVYTLMAEPGFHHEMSFGLLEIQMGTAVALAGNSGTSIITASDTSLTGTTELTNPVNPPDHTDPDPFIDSSAGSTSETGTGGTQTFHPPDHAAPDTSSSTIQPYIASTEVPTSTEDLIAMLTAGGIDMASLANSGSLSSLNQETGIAGSVSATSGQVDSGVPLTADAGTQHVMVFTDIASTTTQVSSDGASFSSRSSGEIMEVLSEKKSSVTFIYNKHLRTDPLLSGTIEIEMIIQPSGRVSDVRILQSNTYNPAFELELARAIETWRFGSVNSNEGALTVQYPFSFSP